MLQTKVWYYVISILLLFSLTVHSAQAQPKDWGDVSERELKMEVFPSDSLASAAVLFDYAEVDYNRNLEYEMERHVRFKILSEDGYDWATVSISYNDELDQKISRVRAVTHVLEDGKHKEYDVGRRDIFDEDVTGGWKQVKFTFPKVKPGAVLEFRYRKLIGHPSRLSGWEFQKSIPVQWSEYKVRIPEWFEYNKMFVGPLRPDINGTERFNESLVYQLKSRNTSNPLIRSTYNNARLDINGTAYRWVMKNLPAVKELPYISSVDNYKAKLWMQMTAIDFPGSRKQVFMQTWKDVIKELVEFEDFGGQLKTDSRFTRALAGLELDSLSERDKIDAIYRYVASNFTWENQLGYIPEDDLTDVFDEKKGSGVELNLLTLQLLRDAGIDADPVLISTRDHGTIFEPYAIIDQFNHVICRAKAGEETYLLDAIEENQSIELLPERDLNGRGLVVNNEDASWVPLKSTEQSSKDVVFQGKISEQGEISGKVDIKASGYYALNEREALNENEKKEDFVKNTLIEKFESVKIDSFDVASVLSGNELSYNVNFTASKPLGSQVSGDFIYLNPVLFMREKENVFKQPVRLIPVDFPHTFRKRFIANYTVPDSFTVAEIPKPVVLNMPGGGAQFRRLIQFRNGTVTVLSSLEISKTQFTPQEYKDLREFYSTIVNSHNEQLVLKKGR